VQILFSRTVWFSPALLIDKQLFGHLWLRALLPQTSPLPSPEQ